ncbi:MAG: SAM-dependent methyltransferase, partial [Actinobacteria bacterium]|nr:SAM-dependent methyltransferase [Actinomycetota bacterium]
VPAAADIPVTHRGIAAAVTAVAAHEPDQLDYAALARVPGTLVFFMGLAGLDRLTAGLLAAGKNAATPAAVISNGTLPGQELVTGELAEIAVLAAGLEPPALVVVGEVVRLAARLGAAAVRRLAVAA